MTTGEVFFDCDERKMMDTWLNDAIIYLGLCNDVGGYRSAGRVENSDFLSWKDRGYGDEENELDFSDPDYYEKLTKLLG